MRILLSLLLSGAFVFAPVSATEKVAVEVGQGNHRMKDANAGFVRYSNDLKIPNLARTGVYEVYAGSWNHDYSNNVVGISLGMQGHWSNFHVDTGLGVAYLHRKTQLSGTHQQFTVHLGAGYTTGRFDFTLVQTHYSNAKWLFEWEGPNVGYDFLTLQIGYILK